jgi:hypothetical protein
MDEPRNVDDRDDGQIKSEKILNLANRSEYLKAIRDSEGSLKRIMTLLTGQSSNQVEFLKRCLGTQLDNDVIRLAVWILATSVHFLQHLPEGGSGRSKLLDMVREASEELDLAITPQCVVQDNFFTTYVHLPSFILNTTMNTNQQ